MTTGTTSSMQVPRRRRGDLLLGLLVAVALHGALCCWGWWFPPEMAAASPLVEVECTAELAVCAEPEPPPMPDVARDAPGANAAGGEPAVAPTIVRLELLQSRVGVIVMRPAWSSPPLGGGDGGFRVDGNVWRDIGREVRMPVFEPAELDRAPVVLSQPLPQYPPALRRTAATGAVLLSFVVDAEGTVRSPRVVESSRPEFCAPALQAVARWKFRPGRKDGRRVATRVEVPIAFALPDGRT